MVAIRSHIINFLVLVAKQYIYRQRCLKKSLVFQEWLGLIKRLEAIEKYIAVKNEKIKTHIKKWAGSHEVIDQDVNQYCQDYLTNLEIDEM